MKSSFGFLFVLIFLQLMIPNNALFSFESVVDGKIKDALQDFKYSRVKLSCTSVSSRGSLSTCPEGTIVTSCACGFGCGSWNIEGEDTCHCQCPRMDWSTARCCHLS
ncbi:resistin-like beta [Sorex fumeus]|uniref:resistin-like beta n=1 Tax=Sorex fumeus TaxID=62283 RepID=UPI0024ADCDE6|nr:resistin-like beta [Sorex fumeus]